MALSYAYGASATTDAYLISQTIPVVVFSFISAGVATAFIPNYSGILNKNGRNQADRYTSNLCNALLLVASVLVAVSGQFKMDINGHEKSPQNGQVKEEKSSPTRIGLVTDSRGEQT